MAKSTRQSVERVYPSGSRLSCVFFFFLWWFGTKLTTSKWSDFVCSLPTDDGGRRSMPLLSVVAMPDIRTFPSSWRNINILEKVKTQRFFVVDKFTNRKQPSETLVVVKSLQAIVENIPSERVGFGGNSSNETKTTKLESSSLPVLTPEALETIGRTSGLLGSTMPTKEVARSLTDELDGYYRTRGYPLCRVTGVMLTSNGTCTVRCVEPILHPTHPVALAFAVRKAKEEDTKDGKRNNYDEPESPPPQQQQPTTTGTFSYVQTPNGRTRPEAIAAGLGLKPGRVFQWDPQRWQRVHPESGIWTSVLHQEPVMLPDGTIQLRVICEERPPRSLEYGVTKSLYNGAWEGELDFEHRNFLGGGERVAVAVRRGARDPEVSYRTTFRDERFGLPGGYAVETFRDYIGTEEIGRDIDDDNNHNKSPLRTRLGASVSLQSPPVIPDQCQCRLATFGIERVYDHTRTRTEDVVSTRWKMGLPFPLERFKGPGNNTDVDVDLVAGVVRDYKRGGEVAPYSVGTMRSQRVWNRTTRTGRGGSGGSSSSGGKCTWAFRHSLTIGSARLPRHEARAVGISAQIRGDRGTNGDDDDDELVGAMVGTTELRIPLNSGFMGLFQSVSLFSWGERLRLRWRDGSGHDHVDISMVPNEEAKAKITPTTTKTTQSQHKAGVVFFVDWSLGRRRPRIRPGYRHHRGGGQPSGLDGNNEHPLITTVHLSPYSFPCSSTFITRASIGLGLRRTVQGIPLKVDFTLSKDGKLGTSFGMGSDFE